MNNWSLKPHARTCFASGKSFQPGERMRCYVYMDEEGHLHRVDVQASEEKGPEEGTIVAQWSRVVAEPNVEEKMARQQQLQTAEEVFLSLYNSPDEAEAPDCKLLKQLLALFIERKRILQRLNKVSDNQQAYLHNPSKKEYWVPMDDFTAEEVMNVQDQLKVILY